MPRYKALNEPCPGGPTRCVVQHASVLSCNSNYFGYITLVKVITRGLFSLLLLIMTLLGTSIGELSANRHYAIDRHPDALCLISLAKKQ
ncbi:hypothetical protein Dda3937_04392 [Dickeya dadantii 3937]|uniref:Uncharacterized protein n=1 Tax=Dickeya dadantii (strain 3937) TaxID=198628 RepID=E0SDM6_DICD3|nr:hypothetical protein Dda3937_04392 [Dickeya dadantii 3937]